MRIVYFGSGFFGLPTLRRLVQEHDVALIVTQPDRPAGRHRTLTPTPIAEFAHSVGIETFKPADPNAAESVSRIHATHADAYVVIAYGHKLGDELLAGVSGGPAINLHASLLPKFRGAAPINWAMIHNERETGVSVIGLARRMDAGPIFVQRETPIDPRETAGELHDRLAAIGADAVAEALDRFRDGTLEPVPQDESEATRAPKLTKADGTVGFDRPAGLARARIHGLNPWPGCTVRLAQRELKLMRVEAIENDRAEDAGTLLPDGTVVCNPGAVRLLEVQPPGGRVMSFDAFARGHGIQGGERLEPL
jgi:methionyl-tRNA formyltransferase